MPTAGDPDDDPIIIGPTVRTPRGWHVYVVPTGRGNSVNVGGLAGVDWRGTGGYAVAPGSIREDGTPWTWYLPGDLLYGPDAEIRPAPAWLLNLLEHRPTHLAPIPGPARSADLEDRYGRHALESELGRLAVAPIGGRNHALVQSAFRLRQLIHAGRLDERTVVEQLVAVAQRIGLADDEIAATIRSGFAGADKSPPRKASA